MMTKQEQRRRSLAARRALTDTERAAASESICESILQLEELQQARLVFSYRAMEDEVELSLVHTRLLAQGVRLTFPVSFPKGRMEAWEPGGWVKGGYDIWEPDRSCSRLTEPDEIDLVLAPCVAFDGENRRLGHGAGYYDRYLPRCSRAVIVAVAFEAQRLEHLVCDAHDVPADIVVTERGVFRR